MKKLLLLLTMFSICIGVNAQTVSQKQIDSKTLDLIIQRLEKSGKLDEALNRVIDKKIKTEKENQARLALEQEKKNQENAKLISGFNDKEHYMGDKEARYSIIVYEDMECPFCQVFAQVPEKVILKVKNVNFISRANPLQFHMPAAAKEAVLAECVAIELGNEGYFNFTRAIFKNTLKNGQGLPSLDSSYKLQATEKEIAIFNEFKSSEKSLFAVAKEIGIKDIETTYNCYKNPQTSLNLQNLLNESAKYGITGTPTIILKDNKTNKSSMISGIMTEEELIDKINNFIAQ